VTTEKQNSKANYM